MFASPGQKKNYTNFAPRRYTQQQRSEYTQTNDKMHFIFTNESCCNLNDHFTITKCINGFCAGRLMNKILYYIDSAEKSIHVAMFTLSNQQLANSIIDAYRRGVEIRIILDRTNSKDQYSQYNRLKKAGKLTLNEIKVFFLTRDQSFI